LIFGNSENIHIFRISETLNTKLLNWHQSQSKSIKPKERKIKGLLLNNKKKGIEGKNMEKYVIDFINMPKKLQKELHSEIRIKIAKAVKSPFAFINTRSWKTLPNNINNFGATSFHRDGFWPGHLKVMIYLGPMDEDFGYFEIENNLIKNKPPGTAILFQNSDLRHRGVSGKKKERLSIEITIFRTFLNLEQNNDSHFRGRHYTNIFKPYFNQ
tara:strand:- start:1446 stop:2084 length:639 start_codon:yes stop_codon:yes gene_type:complete